MKVPSKYFVAHRVPLRAWVKYKALALYHAVPDALVQPYLSETGHVFVCGCGHGGTTLLAAKLGQHSKIMLIGRETQLFEATVGAACARRVAQEWDYFAGLSGHETVLEKTPKHVQYIPKIRRVLPEARIVLISRNPLDNVTSLHKRFKDLPSAIDRWLADNRAVLAHKDRPGICFATYEDLVSRSREVLGRIVDFIGHPWEDAILDEAGSDYAGANTRGTMALRARQVSKPITRNIGGWREHLTKDQAEMILARTADVAAQLGYPADIAGYDASF